MPKGVSGRKKGGRKRAFQSDAEYRLHVRDMTKQGLGNKADGGWEIWTKLPAGIVGSKVHDHVVGGYNFDKGR